MRWRKALKASSAPAPAYEPSPAVVLDQMVPKAVAMQVWRALLSELDDRGRPVFARPGQTFGPELDVHAEFGSPGTYRLWGQFRLATGDVLTVPFTVEAS